MKPGVMRRGGKCWYRVACLLGVLAGGLLGGCELVRRPLQTVTVEPPPPERAKAAGVTPKPSPAEREPSSEATPETGRSRQVPSPAETASAVGNGRRAVPPSPPTETRPTPPSAPKPIPELTLTEAERQAEFAAKVQRLESFLAGRKLDALLLKRAENFAWLSGGGSNRGGAGMEGEVGALLLRRGGKRYMLAANEDVYRLLNEELAGLDFLPKTFKWYKAHVRDEELALVQSLTGQEKVGADVAYPGTAFVGREIDTLRRTLTAAEVRKVRWLGRQAAAAVAAVADTLTKGDTEDDAAARLTRELLATRMEPVSVRVTADERMRQYGPAAPRRTPIEQAAVLSVVARRWGLTVCLTRTVYLGPPSAQAQQQKALARIAAALQAATRPGATLGQILHAGAQAYQEAGYAELWEQSDPGGIIGYRVREAAAFPNSSVPVRESQAVVWRTRLPQACVEDTFLVTRTGLENLTRMADWPSRTVTVAGRTYEVPDVLVRRET